jgi:tripeptide aminopeptidase
MTLLKRFINYVTMDTQSDPHSSAVPSTAKQLHLIELLKKELITLGVKRIKVSTSGTLYATIPSNIKKNVPSIGLMAHVDTASEMSGKNVKPKIIKAYDGQPITLNTKLGVHLDPAVFPSLRLHKGKTLITTDGTTLLGADDKAGIAIIMTFIETIMQDSNIPHGPIQIAFTCDEEIGRGVTHFDHKLFGADYAYTLDGGPLGEINYENFNASSAVVSIQGKAIHPGSAKNQMINSQTIASRFHLALPEEAKPEHTDQYEGFIHLTETQGSVELTTLHYILREHDLKKLNRLETIMLQTEKKIKKEFPKADIQVKITPSYFNMRSLIEKQPEGLNRALKAYQTLGIPVQAVPIRGGTDGAMLTYQGVPTPNLATGGENYHGKYEFLVLEDAEKMVHILLEITRNPS